MSLIQFILDLADELYEFSRSFASSMDVDDFGFGMYPHELQQTSPRRSRTMSQMYWLPNTRGRHHPYCRGGGASGGANSNNSSCNIGKSCCGRSPVTKDVPCLSEKENVTKSATASGSTTAAYSVVNKNGFQVSMNVKQFSPNELTVKTIDNCVVVEGQHDEKEDGHGVISRHFIRKYMLPKGFDPNEVLSTLSSDGILTVKAPPPVKAEDKLERVVHIHQTGPAQLAKDVGVTNKEKEKVLQTISTTSTTQTLPVMQQQQQAQLKQQSQLSQQHHQHQQQKRDEEKKNEVNERNGDTNSNEINEQQVPKPETILSTTTTTIEPMVLVANIVTTAGIDAIVSGATANASVTGATMEEKNEIDTNVSDIPMADVSVPAGVIESIVLVAPDNGASDGVAVGIINETPNDSIVIPTPPSAGDLVAAADAATILLVKTQCENGSNVINEEELAN